MNSAILIGEVRHRRFAIKPHQFNYQVFMLYINLAELDDLFKDYWLWSSQGFNIAAFKRKKYLGPANESLLISAKKLVKANTGDEPDTIYLLTNLAYYGYCFNPISIYFCYTTTRLTHCIVEVSNTPWGEQHAYVIDMQQVKSDIYKSNFKKELHVSPFLEMDYQYHLTLKHNSQQTIVQLENWRNNLCDFDAMLSLKSQPINSRNLAKLLLFFPFMTGKIIFTIYWQALKLWLKRIPVINH